MWWLLGLGLALTEPPSDQTLVYYNARMALREGNHDEALRLWFLRNAIQEQTGVVSIHDPDFLSVTWVALGDVGVCQDGHRTDEDGAGLWPLALHNWVVRNMGRRPPPLPAKPFKAFDLSRQQRFVSVNDILDTKELGAVRFFQGPCTLPTSALLRAGERPDAELSDRQVTARLLRDLLERARLSLKQDHVRGRSAIEARLFDLDLQLTELAAREARQEELEDLRRGRAAGMLRGSMDAIREEAPPTTLGSDTEAARILQACVDWPVSEWMALSPDRRLFLFDHAREQVDAPAKLETIALGVLDRLIDDQKGDEAEDWIARIDSKAPVWSGERGAALLALDREAGFSERGVVAMHRGLYQLETGEMTEALRSLAYALRYAQESKDPEAVENLSLRWVSYVASQFEINDELMLTLKKLVPRREYSMLLEDLLWRAALRADTTSFDRGQRYQLRGNAMERRLLLLEPLAKGDLTTFDRQIRRGLKDGPNETLQFLEQFLQRLELEDAQVRSAHIPTLVAIIELLQPMLEGDPRGRAPRKAAELADRSQAILEGLGALSNASPEQRGHTLSPSSEVYAGSLRLAPSDPVPWPFPLVQSSAPSVFEPLKLTPVEWHQDGVLVFGWEISG
ncbi:MAG: hypothetical protein ACI9VR_004349 [Cognaticolwellia sp.]|jgi:hypothetical protein